MYNGILPVYKERGLTSHDVVFKLRKILKTKKIGHTGTLDPEVSGVLPVCIGTATRVSDYVMDMGKSYNATITLGESTTTEDQTGEVIDKVDVQENAININEVDAILKQFEGIIEQVPPMYSSVKVNGKKLYEYARKGETVERPVRKVNIDSIARTSKLQFEDGKCHFNIEVKCGKGTYIRTLATDIGKQLGYPAHMSLLTRINSGGFDIKDSITLDQISQLHEQDTLQSHLFPLEYGLKSLPKIYVSDENIKTRILNGQKFNKKQFNQTIEQQLVFIDSETEKVMAIYIQHPEKNHEIKPKKVFN
ncbi:tRNA pseudouridine(55) synthase TruB [Staphylococcus haemolyticus]|uniref:tRNA pseudouridine synthase B n=1 Tax=Staphylococcus haemolyticus TaxID=1283 RepID=A0AB38PD54_STAHA|nr:MULTISPECIES: tRNA pseudouridine(55) synthase TruB [Staphylococcus]MCE4964531.1 tRNA pseudouridine(55) synthase TruB [Staphylococcus haemolyticus]MCE4988261.1 tRNA pseudouridine(55) synthase TruB [Staphylococcus haemolyticus]MCE4992784.1 tRNA pseudouridine(55) synthase TruB [Staphylococcus haemolyticus]MCE5037027.1 tRNA pseudouridine(55) synthase TruB [Staphylococcus haemolyticus]MCE5051025.1 tRNA pseudouridine(55) synthase TruB [Staphylococcus haemolyticus]